MNPSTPPKGSLEDLFRHHLLESETAAVPPRPQVWEQLYNSLLLAQNEQYRRRLQVHRWAIAASLLLASLAGGGWWHSQRAPTPLLATAAGQAAANRPGLATARRAATATALPTPPLANITSRATYATTKPNLSAIDQTATLRAAAQPTIAYTAIEGGDAGITRSSTSASTRRFGSAGALAPFGSSTRAAAEAAGYAVNSYLPQPLGRAVGAATGTRATPLAAISFETESQAAAVALAGQPAASDLVTPAAGSPDPTSLGVAINELAVNQISLATTSGAALPTNLSPVAVTMPPIELTRPWQFGLSYAASAYQPNIDFTKTAAAYSSTMGINSVRITNTAAVEYRNNLRAGLGQRLSFWATRRLGGSRWRLRTGLELAQNTATSATSVSFVGEQVADLTYAQAAQAHLQRTSYRYRSASAAAEMRYASPIKTGFSFYGRVGALLTALLNVRSDVDGTPEATRTYTLLSASSPYRHLTTSLRGGGGIQYRPAGHQWALNLGPVAEFGILSLNADPSQDFWRQQRPYSFGLEAGLELGRPLKIQ